MQTLSSMHLLLPEAEPSPRGPMVAASDELEHRRPHLVWANEETLETAVPTLGTALIQHGLKEWLGSDGATRLLNPYAMVSGRRAALAAMAQALGPVLDRCEAENAMPIVLCSDPALAAHWVSQRVASEHGMLMAVGSPYNGPGRDAATKNLDAPFPLDLQNKPAAAATIWLGAPVQRSTLQVPVADGMRVDFRQTKAGSVRGHLAAAEARLGEIAPSMLVCVLYIDDLCVPAGSAQGLSAEVFAATLRWLQALTPWVVVFMVSHERVTAAGRHQAAELARHLGGALLKHRGLKRGGWGQAVTGQIDIAPYPLNAGPNAGLNAGPNAQRQDHSPPATSVLRPF